MLVYDDVCMQCLFGLSGLLLEKNNEEGTVCSVSIMKCKLFSDTIYYALTKG